MVVEKSELSVTVPSFFRCPISMDVMKSPVSLCTGVTYDRSSIQTWLRSGNNTCPATMQVLPSTDVVPNLTLRRLISLWSDSLLHFHQSEDASIFSLLSPTISKPQLLNSIKSLINKKHESYFDSISTISDFAKYSEENRQFLTSIDEFLPAMIGVLINVNEIEIVESVINVIYLISNDNRVIEQLHRLIFRSDRDCLSPFLLILQRGNSNSKIQSAKILESIVLDTESQYKIAEKQGVLYELYCLIEADQMPVIQAGLSVIIAISKSRAIKKELVQFGIVKTAAKILSNYSDAVIPVIEKTLKVLQMVSTCTQGRTAICEDEKCVAAIVQRLMKVSDIATEHGVTVVWSVCYLSRDGRAEEEVMKNNGVTKVLLVMQSNCSMNVRQMCRDLVKIFKVNSKSCLASYETKTTHIMPY